MENQRRLQLYAGWVSWFDRLRRLYLYVYVVCNYYYYCAFFFISFYFMFLFYDYFFGFSIIVEGWIRLYTEIKQALCTYLICLISRLPNLSVLEIDLFDINVKA